MESKENLQKKEWLRVFEYAEITGEGSNGKNPFQNIYRKIREGKITDIKREQVMKEVIYIKNPLLNKNTP